MYSKYMCVVAYPFCTFLWLQNITVEEEDLPIPTPPPVAVVGTAGEQQPPPQRDAGSTTEDPGTSSAPPPPPQRPATPPPVLDATSRAEFKRRCEARKAALGGYNKKLSPQEAHKKWTLLVEDNEDRSNCCGDWLWEDFTEDVPFINENVDFAFETQGLSQTAKGANSEIDFLTLFLTEPVLKNLVDQTNLYASQEGVNRVGGDGKYIPVTRESLMAFIGLTIAMGLACKSSIAEYWSTDQVLETPWYGQVMSRSLYQQHRRYLQVADNKMGEKTADGRFCDKLYEVRPLLDSLVQSFQKHYSPGRELSIDEMMIGTKCRLSFLQCMKDKPTKWG
ncbi:transposase [Apostichopus japonicus]|uniref:Transposase n=1 Tax=Stichopus japonicus TaxID=307972 RepID=A0A2G8LIS6_STIJA|nr:transposase [Apostichopus japonicus]